MSGRSRAILLSAPAIIVALYFIFGYYAAYYMPVSEVGGRFSWVNYLGGSFSAVFLSNFVFDGIGNVEDMAIFLALFVVTVMILPPADQRAWTAFLLVMMFAISTLSMTLGRAFLPLGVGMIGQSGVVAAAGGVILTIAVIVIITHTSWFYRVEILKATIYVTILAAGFLAALVSLYGFLNSILAVEVVHFSALGMGAALTVAYYFLAGREGRKEKEKTAYLIPEKVRA